jgi:hypothetical protein
MVIELPPIVWTDEDIRLAKQRYPAEYQSFPMSFAAERCADLMVRERQLIAAEERNRELMLWSFQVDPG